jgi:hypothetical protein
VAEPFVLIRPRGLTWIIDPPFDPDGQGWSETVRVEIRADGLSAETRLDSVDGLVADAIPRHTTRLGDFLASLAANWRGWEGDRCWTALENELTISARHDGRRHVLLAVIVRRPCLTFAEDAWSARVVFTLEAGEELTSIARDVTFVLDGR